MRPTAVGPRAVNTNLFMVRGTAGIAQFGLQPAEAIGYQCYGPLAGFGRSRGTGVVSTQQLHQRGAELLGGAAGPLGFKRMPVPIADRQAAL